METSTNILTLLWQYILSVFSFNPDSPLLFTQFQFWAFFALVFTFFALFKSKPLMRNTYLLFVSLLFYYKTSGLFVGLLIFVTLSDFFIAKGISRAKDKGRLLKARLLLCLSVTIDLSILCYFKYAYFFADFVNNILGTNIEVTNVMASLGNTLTGTNFFCVDNIILPVGISFYTFQIISYTCDVYKGLVKPVRNIFDFGFYVSFFPQLVAGPIVKASDFIPQLYRKYNLSRMQFGIAVFWIINGLLKKIILSDYLAVNFIDRVFD
ncbi:MAG: MBOAT family protein, partial [Bacteroidaceae bacterium]